MKSARIICCELDSTLRPTIKRGFDIIPACAGIDMTHSAIVKKLSGNTIPKFS
jgi:hypothetical protein